MDPASRALEAAHALNDLHPDLVEDGCGDVAVVVHEVLRRQGIDAQVRSGYANLDDEPVLHAWLVVDGRVVDPTWQVLFGRQGRQYEEDPGVLRDLLCLAEDPEDLRTYADEVELLLSAPKQNQGIDIVVRHLDTFGSPGGFEHKFMLLGGDLDANEVYGRMDVTVFEDRAHVDWVEVKPEHRRKGVARALYRRLYEWASDQGYEVEHGMQTEEGAAMAAALSPELEQLKQSLMASHGSTSAEPR